MTTSSIWKKENIAPITKMGIEGTVAAASLAAAITTILVATGAIAGPAFLASVANPVGIVALFVAAVYFAVAAYTSYQQMHKNEEISGADITGKATQAVSDAVARANIIGQVTQPVSDAVARANIIGQVTQPVNSAKDNLVGKDEVVSTFLDRLEGENVENLKTKLGFMLSVE